MACGDISVQNAESFLSMQPGRIWEQQFKCIKYVLLQRKLLLRIDVNVICIKSIATRLKPIVFINKINILRYRKRPFDEYIVRERLHIRSKQCRTLNGKGSIKYAYLYSAVFRLRPYIPVEIFHALYYVESTHLLKV